MGVRARVLRRGAMETWEAAFVYECAMVEVFD